MVPLAHGGAEGLIGSERSDDYHFGGFAMQGLVGVNRHVRGSMRLFSEYKIAFADLDVDFDQTCKVSTDLWTNQILFGPEWEF